MSRGDFKVYYGQGSCSVRVMDDVPTNWAIAEAMRISDEMWFINRVLVREPSRRGRGLGGQALDAMLTKLRNENVHTIIVTPGGYDGDEERQIKFYVKHGFVEIQNGRLKGAYCRQLVTFADDVDENMHHTGRTFIQVPIGVSEGDYICHGFDRWKWTAETVTIPKVVEVKNDHLYTDAGSVAEMELDDVGELIRGAKPEMQDRIARRLFGDDVVDAAKPDEDRLKQ